MNVKKKNDNPRTRLLTVIETIAGRIGARRAALARQAGVDPSTLSQLARGRTVAPSRQVVRRFVDHYGVNESWVWTGEGEMFERQPDIRDLAGGGNDRAEVASDNLELYRSTVRAQEQTIAAQQRTIAELEAEVDRLRRKTWTAEVKEAGLLNEPEAATEAEVERLRAALTAVPAERRQAVLSAMESAGRAAARTGTR